MRTMTVEISDGIKLTLVEDSPLYKAMFGGLETEFELDQIHNPNVVIDETNGLKMLSDFPHLGTVKIG